METHKKVKANKKAKDTRAQGHSRTVIGWDGANIIGLNQLLLLCSYCLIVVGCCNRYIYNFLFVGGRSGRKSLEAMSPA